MHSLIIKSKCESMKMILKKKRGEFNMRKRKWLKRLFSVATVLLMVFALAPSKVDAFSESSVYSDPTTGIDISLSEGPGASTLNKTVTFTVIVDGVTVEPGKTISDIPTYSGYINVNAEGYDVTYSRSGDLTAISNEGLMTFLDPSEGTGNCTINLATSKTSDSIKIGEYGTFSWSKQHAGTSAYARKITIYVNGAWACEEEINTPRDLSNLGAQKQYWFTPSDSYESAYKMDPSEGLDTTTRKNLRIDLTTKCGCGRDTCLCKGGCICPEDCECDECMGTNLADNQINTGYGILEYSKATGDGYNLTVKINLNGNTVYTSPKLRVSMGLPGNLWFTPTDGSYYFQTPNDYDISTLMSGSTWLRGTGQLSIVGVSQEVRDFDNVLTINLVSFENSVSLDIERDGSTDNYVNGYRISYTLDGVNYSYDYYRFEASQTPNIPTNVPVTITAICEKPYEVNEWYSSFTGAGNITLEGSKGQDGSSAYGNSVTLTVNSSNDLRIMLRTINLSTVSVPSEDDLLDPEGILKDGAVTIDCINEAVNHESKTYGLIEDTFTIGKLEGNSADGYTVDVTVNDLTPYLNAYNGFISGHSLAEGETSKTITLHWNNATNDKNKKGTWEEDVNARPTIKVICETTTDEPDGPTVPEIEELLENGAVTIDCVNKAVNHSDKTYGPIEGSYHIGDVIEDEDNGTYTSTIMFNSEPYINSYNNDVAQGHILNDAEDPAKDIQFIWDSVENKWMVAEKGSPVTFQVICDSSTEPTDPEQPDDPTIDDINGLYPDGIVGIDCVTDDSHETKMFAALENSVDIGSVQEVSEGQYTSTITFHAQNYVDQYSEDMGKAHTLADGQSDSATIVLSWNGDAWQAIAETVTPVFKVECDTTSTDPGTDPGTEDPGAGTEDPGNQKPGSEDENNGSGDNSGDSTKDSSKSDSKKSEGTDTATQTNVGLMLSLISLSICGGAVLAVLKKKKAL